MQSHQSVLKGIGIINQKFILKTDFFYKLTAANLRLLLTPFLRLPYHNKQQHKEKRKEYRHKP